MLEDVDTKFSQHKTKFSGHYLNDNWCHQCGIMVRFEYIIFINSKVVHEKL